MPSKLNIDRDKLVAFCRKWHIRRLWLFGSVLRDDFREGSDVDVLVEFEDGHIPGLKFITIQNSLTKILGDRKVDLVLESDLNQRIKGHPYFQPELIYAQG